MALNGWRLMWVVAIFDLPTQTKIQRKRYSQFRKLLMEQGFAQMQYSVYIRDMPTFHKAQALVNRLGPCTPPDGECAFLFITDKQYGLTRNFFGGAENADIPQKPEQLLLFD